MADTGGTQEKEGESSGTDAGGVSESMSVEDVSVFLHKQGIPHQFCEVFEGDLCRQGYRVRCVGCSCLDKPIGGWFLVVQPRKCIATCITWCRNVHWPAVIALV